MSCVAKRDVELRVSIVVDDELVRVLLQQLAKAHSQARISLFVIGDPDLAVNVAWIPQLRKNFGHSLLLCAMASCSGFVGCRADEG